MKLCVYTTNHAGFLKYAVKHPSSKSTAFYSDRRWVGALRYRKDFGEMPVLIRDIEDKHRPFACTYVADLVEIKFSDQFTDQQRRKWLMENLSVQREWYKSKGWDDFEEEEVEGGMEKETFYLVRGLKRIKPIPLGRLIKSSDGKRLSGEYKYGYSICRYPTVQVKQ